MMDDSLSYQADTVSGKGRTDTQGLLDGIHRIDLEVSLSLIALRQQHPLKTQLARGLLTLLSESYCTNLTCEAHLSVGDQGGG